MQMSWQTNRDTHIEIKCHCKKRLTCCQVAVCVLWVKSLNISPHCPQSVPEIIRILELIKHLLYGFKVRSYQLRNC